jgi:NAD(P)H-dependent FMN reductase
MKIAIISASVRNGRMTHRVALGLEKELDRISGIECFVVDLKDIPMSLWEETYVSKEVNHRTFEVLKSEMDAADAFIFVSPEYNGSYTSALKNLIDFFPKKTFSDKPISVVSVTTGRMGGMRAALQMQQLVLAIFAYPQPNMLLVSEVQKKFNEKGDLIDPGFQQTLKQFIDDFTWFTSALHHAKVNLSVA